MPVGEAAPYIKGIKRTRSSRWTPKATSDSTPAATRARASAWSRKWTPQLGACWDSWTAHSGSVVTMEFIEDPPSLDGRQRRKHGLWALQILVGRRSRQLARGGGAASGGEGGQQQQQQQQQRERRVVLRRRRRKSRRGGSGGRAKKPLHCRACRKCRKGCAAQVRRARHRRGTRAEPALFRETARSHWLLGILTTSRRTDGPQAGRPQSLPGRPNWRFPVNLDARRKTWPGEGRLAGGPGEGCSGGAGGESRAGVSQERGSRRRRGVQ